MMKLKTLLLALLPVATTMAQPAAQRPEAGQTYYIYNLNSAGYLYDSNKTLSLSSAGTPVTLTDADPTAGTFYMTASEGHISVTPFSGISTDGSGTYDQWFFTPVEGKNNIYNISYRMKEGNTFPFLYADATTTAAGALKILPYAPAVNYTEGQWIFVAESDYTDNTIVLDENSETYSAPAGTNMTVKLKRTFSPGCWNTFCVPFDIDAAQLSSAFGKDVRLAEYSGCTDMVLNFKYSDKAEAGKPYLIYISASHEAPAEGCYVFTGINRFVEEPQPVTYDAFTLKGCFTAVNVPTGSYVISRNTLYHTDKDMTVKGFRGFITSTASGKLNGWSLDEGTDGIDGITSDKENAGGQIYTIGGQKMRNGASDTKDMPEGVYVVKGKKIVIK